MPHELANYYDDNTEKQKHSNSRHFDLVGNSFTLRKESKGYELPKGC